jgi:hypothetical protein
VIEPRTLRLTEKGTVSNRVWYTGSPIREYQCPLKGALTYYASIKLASPGVEIRPNTKIKAADSKDFELLQFQDQVASQKNCRGSAATADLSLSRVPV